MFASHVEPSRFNCSCTANFKEVGTGRRCPATRRIIFRVHPSPDGTKEGWRRETVVTGSKDATVPSSITGTDVAIGIGRGIAAIGTETEMTIAVAGAVRDLHRLLLTDASKKSRSAMERSGHQNGGMSKSLASMLGTNPYVSQLICISFF